MALNKQEHSDGYMLYTRRWYMLAVVVMFNVSNAIIWISFAPVTNYTASYFNVKEATVNYFSLVFFIVFAPFCGVSWWTIETLGFRFSVIAGTLLNSAGAIVRAISVLTISDLNTRFIVVMVGQAISACTQPLVLSMPTKLAALWFGDHERTVANTIASMANPLGVLIANGVAVGIVTSAHDIKLLMIVTAIPAIIAAVMAIVGFRSSRPPSPPSASAMVEAVSFFTGIKTVLKNRQFILLALTSGAGIGAFSAITTILQQVICVKGYSNTVAGVAGALVIVGGFIGSGITGFYVDTTRKYIDLAKIFGLLLCGASALVVIFSSMRDQTVLLIISFTLFGFFGLGGIVVFLELGVECTYPVDEATSSGVQWMFGQIIGVIMMVGSVAAAPKLTASQIEQSSCLVEGDKSLDPVDLSIPLLVLSLVCGAIVLVFTMFFDTQYKRLTAEKQISDLTHDALENVAKHSGSGYGSTEETPRVL